jgi:hypothetical protein
MKKSSFLKALFLFFYLQAQSFASIETFKVTKEEEAETLSGKSLTFLPFSSQENERIFNSLGFLPKKFPNVKIPRNLDPEAKQQILNQSSQKMILSLLNGVGIFPKSMLAIEILFVQKVVKDFQGKVSEVSFSWLFPEKKSTYKNSYPSVAKDIFEKQRKKGPLTPSEKSLFEWTQRPELTHLEALVIAAEFIKGKIQQDGRDGVGVIFPGRSGNLIQKAFELAQQEEGTSAIPCYQINFSGSPDSCALKAKQDPNQKINENSSVVTKNYVTDARLDYFLNYLSKEGLNKKFNKLFLIDLIGRGGSLNSFIRLLNFYYNHLGIPVPDMEILDFGNRLYGNNTFEYDREKEKLTYLEDTKFGIAPLSIHAKAIPLPDNLVGCFDHPDWQCFLSHGVYFPAENWHEGFEALFEKGGEWHADFYKEILPKIEEIIKLYHKNNPGLSK